MFSRYLANVKEPGSVQEDMACGFVLGVWGRGVKASEREKCWESREAGVSWRVGVTRA